MPTKAAPKNNIVVSSLDAVVLTMLEPVIAALDHQVNEFGEVVETHIDAGHEKPSQRDMMLRIVLGNILQTLHNQAYGALNTRSGTKMPNAKEQLDTSEQRVAEMMNRIEDSSLTERDLVTLHWFKVNEAKFTWLNEMITGFNTVYKKLTNETWKPYVQAEQKKLDISEEEKKRLLALVSNVKGAKKGSASATV